MNRALRSAAASLVLAGSLAIAGAAAAIVTAGPATNTRVFPPVAPTASAALSFRRVTEDDFFCDWRIERDPLPEDAATVVGGVLDRSMPHAQPAVWKPP